MSTETTAFTQYCLSLNPFLSFIFPQAVYIDFVIIVYCLIQQNYSQIYDTPIITYLLHFIYYIQLSLTPFNQLRPL